MQIINFHFSSCYVLILLPTINLSLSEFVEDHLKSCLTHAILFNTPALIFVLLYEAIHVPKTSPVLWDPYLEVVFAIPLQSINRPERVLEVG